MTNVAKLIAIAAIAISSTSAFGVTASMARTPPLGYQLMCLKTPAECKMSGPSQIVASEPIVSLLQRVNQQVNRSIAPRNDQGADVWTVGASTGDCEDYVLAKRRKLINAGLPASSLRIAHVVTRAGEDHAILVVNTRQGKFVLDNLSNTIKPLSQAGYRVVSMQGASGTSWS